MSIDALFLGGTSIDLIQDRETKRPHPKFTASIGGSVTNTCVIASKLGLKTAILSRIGKDLLGEFAIRSLDSCGVNTRGIILDSNIRTPLAVANIDKHGNSIYTFYKNTPKESVVPLEMAPKNLLKGCKMFHFGSSFSYRKETYLEALKYIKSLKKMGKFISFDPNLRPYALKGKIEAKKRVFRLLKLVDLAKLSQMDIEFLTGQEDPKIGLKRLKNRVPCEIILTLGSKGCMYYRKNRDRYYFSLHLSLKNSICPCFSLPAFKVKVADTIGAGDAFTAALLYKLSRVGKKAFFADIKPHLIFASAVSAIICTKPGANQALKNLAQVKKFLSK